MLYKKRNIRSQKDAYHLMKHFLGNLDSETFIVISLTIKNAPLPINICHVESLNACIVHQREVMKSAILSNTVSIMVGHNYPSDNSIPPPENIAVTKRLAEAGSIAGIELLDHVIIGDDNYMSLKEKGYIG